MMKKLNFKIISFNIVNKKPSLNEYQKDDMKEKISKARKTDTYKRLKKEFKEMKGQN